MNKKIASIALGGLALLLGCNNMAVREDLVATVGGAPVYRADVDFTLATLPPEERYGESANGKIRSLIENRQKAEAARRHLGDPKGELAQKLAKTRSRSLSQTYQYFFLGQGLGFGDDSLRAHYLKHQDLFAKDTLARGRFSLLRSQIARDLLLRTRHADVQTFFQSNQMRFGKPASVTVLLLQSSDSLKVVAAQGRLAAGESPDSVVSINEDAIIAGKNAVLELPEGLSHPVFARYGLDPGKVFSAVQSPIGAVGPVWAQSGKFISYKILNRRAAMLPTFDSVRAQVEDAFVEDYKNKLLKDSPALLREKYHVVVEAVVPQGLEEFYNAHKADFTTLKGYKLWHIELTDSSKLASLRDSVKTLASFQATAASITENSSTRLRKGDMGVVKLGHCLPWGVGMLPALFDSLEGKSKGYLTSVLRAPDTQKYHLFYLDSIVLPQIKPLDRARGLVREAMSQNGDFPVDSNFVLARMGDQPLVRERDVLTLREEIPPMQRTGYTREKLLPFLIDWAVSARAAEDAGLDRTADFQAWRRIQEDELYVGLLQDSVLRSSLGIPESDLRTVYEKNADSLFSEPFESSKQDVATWMTMPDISFRREFALRHEAYKGFSDWKAAKADIYKKIRYAEYFKAQRRLLFRYQQELPIVVLDSSVSYSAPQTADEMLKRAREFYGARKYQEAVDQLLWLRDCFPSDEAKQEQVSMELAKVYNDTERWNEAADEYQIYASLWPQSPEAYKALFMQGFILSENLKKDSLALPVFKSLLKRYPKTDLTDDAEWMIRNIESGGQLVPALLDSISKADSLAAPVAPAAGSAVAPAPAASAPATTPVPVPPTPTAQPAAKP